MFGIIPVALSALSAILGAKNKPKSGLDPAQQQLMNQALQIQNQRMLLANPLYEQNIALMRSLMPRSSQPGSYALPNIGTQTQNARRRYGQKVNTYGDQAPMSQAVASLADYLSQQR